MYCCVDAQTSELCLFPSLPNAPDLPLDGQFVFYNSDTDNSPDSCPNKRIIHPKYFMSANRD